MKIFRITLPLVVRQPTKLPPPPPIPKQRQKIIADYDLEANPTLLPPAMRPRWHEKPLPKRAEKPISK